jgi:hypothetical protein
MMGMVVPEVATAGEEVIVGIKSGCPRLIS